MAFYLVENLRGWHAMKTFRDKWEARGYWFDIADRPHPPKPAEGENLFDHEIATKAIKQDNLRIPSDLRSKIYEIQMQNRSDYRAASAFSFGLGDDRQADAKLFLQDIASMKGDLDAMREAIFQSKMIWTEPPKSVSEHIESQASMRLAMSYRYRAIAYLSTGKNQQAFLDTTALIRLNQLPSTNGSMVDFLAKQAISSSSISPIIWEALKHKNWDEQQLLGIQTLLEKATEWNPHRYTQTIPRTNF